MSFPADTGDARRSTPPHGATPSAAFVPARPQPPARFPAPWQLLRLARRDLLSFWPESSYVRDMGTKRLLRQQVVLANCPEAVRHIMFTHNARYERKSPQMRRALEYLLGDGLFVSDGDTWKTRRRAVNPILHRNRLDRFTPMMVEAAQERADAWAAKGPQGRVDMLSEMAALTAEVIARAVFGGELGSTAAAQVIDGFTEYQQRIDQFNLGYFLGLSEGLPAPKGPRLRRAAGKVHTVVDEIVARHARGADDDQSLVATLTRKKDRKTGRSMSATGVRNEAATIFMAGHETTAASMTWLWYILANAPEVEARMHREIAEVVGARAPTMADVPKLAYTRAVIDETLRLYPPVPLLSRQAGADDHVCGVKVEKGSLILVVPWLLHRHRKYWDDPDTFRPERFLGEETPRDSFCYIPFAAGPRICAGLSFAQYEMVLLVAVLARRFRPRVAPGHTVRPVCRLTLRPEGGMPMDLNPTSP